jgi:hypothetical protein
MRTKYISLTTAINFWEEYKIDYVQKHMNPIIGEKDMPLLIDKVEIEKTGDLINHIARDKISLFGKKEKENIVTKIPRQILSFITIEDGYPLDLHRYVICNNYDYKESYNPSINYDVLKRYSTGVYLYTELSIESEELNDYIKALFTYWWA